MFSAEILPSMQVFNTANSENLSINADYIFISLGKIRAFCGIFKNGVLLRYTLEGVSRVANFITFRSQ